MTFYSEQDETYCRIAPEIQKDAELMAQIQSCCQEFALVPAVNEFGRHFIFKVKLHKKDSTRTRMEFITAAQSQWTRCAKEESNKYRVKFSPATEIEQDARFADLTEDEIFKLAFEDEITSATDERIKACRVLKPRTTKTQPPKRKRP